ncbi:O-antigen ligase family protein [Trichococcus shcherbakoviae subsp. psychrophilus]|uniref:O-antigen ligase family protein n=2 Tax=Trichococcus shcherbakoviae TaxID=2094020 RepID=A0A5C5E6P4_9LACT|nr:O-antigen ligase family protein [Trichococcus shcherbakoviae subsp. psychrophilus]
MCTGYFLFSAVFQNLGMLKLFKEFLMIIILTSILFRMKIDKVNLIDISIISFLVMVGLSYMFFTENKVSTLYIIRCYIEPFIIYFIAKNTKWNIESFNNFIIKIFNFTFWLSLYGMFQAHILKDVFLMNIGYPTFNGKLTNPFYLSGFGRFQRVVSTFVNPNMFAFFLGVIILIAYCNKSLFNNIKMKYLKFSVVIVALLLTFSRSNLIPFVICLIFYGLYNSKHFGLNIKKILMSLLIFMIVTSILKYNFDIDIINYFIKLTQRTISLEDTSAAGRPIIWRSAFNRFKDNIFGIGLGKTGSKSVYIGNEMLEPAESSYLTLLLDTGIQGFICYIFIFVSIMYSCFKNMNKANNIVLRDMNLSLIYLTLYIFIALAFSNYVLDFEIMSVYYCIVAIINKIQKNSKNLAVIHE